MSGNGRRGFESRPARRSIKGEIMLLTIVQFFHNVPLVGICCYAAGGIGIIVFGILLSATWMGIGEAE